MTHPSTAPDFPSEELFDHARGNATAFILALLDYAREQGQTPESAAIWAGSRFAPGWDELPDRSVGGVARAIAINVVSTGAEMVSITADAHHAEVVIANWPSQGTLEFFDTTIETAHAIYSAFGPIVDRIGHRYAWRPDGDRVIVTIDEAS